MNKHTVELLGQHFDTAFSAPDGIKKLRELILTLAMQGKLVPQDPNDPAASQLLEEIKAEKNRLMKAGKIKAPKPLPEIKPAEMPYLLPQGWEWVRLDDISTKIHYGYTASANHELDEVRLLRITDIQDNKVEWETVPGCDAKKEDVTQYLLASNDILIARTGGTVGKSFLVKDISVNAVFASYLIRVVPSIHIDVNYLKYCIESPLYWKQLYAACSGTGQPNVNGTSLSLLFLTLPPLAEQNRIVAKIDELMARCDAMEKLCTAQEEKRLAVHTAAIKQLLNIAEPDEHHRAQAFLSEHFADLYTVKANVTELRKAILQLAVMGKLVPQDPNDLPASELLKEIEAEKKQLVKEGKIKATKPLPSVTKEEMPYMPREGWIVVRLQDVLDVRDGTHDSPKDAIGSQTYPLITSKNFVNGNIDFSGARQISAEDHFEIVKRSRVEKYDILFSMIGGNIGNQVIVEDDREFSIKNVALFKYYNNRLTKPYFIKRFMEHLAIDLQQKAAGGAQPFVSLGFLRNIVIALPPVLEQERIVAKIDQLMLLCDSLDQQIDAATAKKTALLNAVISEM